MVSIYITPKKGWLFGVKVNPKLQNLKPKWCLETVPSYGFYIQFLIMVSVYSSS